MGRRWILAHTGRATSESSPRMAPRWTSPGSKSMGMWLPASSSRVRASLRSMRMSSWSSCPTRATTSRTGSAASAQTCVTTHSTSPTMSCDPGSSPGCLWRTLPTHASGLVGPGQRRAQSRRPLPLGLPCPLLSLPGNARAGMDAALPQPAWCSHPIYSLSTHCSHGAGGALGHWHWQASRHWHWGAPGPCPHGDVSAGRLPARDIALALPGDAVGGTHTPQGRGFRGCPPLPAAGNKGAQRWPCPGASLAAVRGGWGRRWQP